MPDVSEIGKNEKERVPEKHLTEKTSDRKTRNRKTLDLGSFSSLPFPGGLRVPPWRQLRRHEEERAVVLVHFQQHVDLKSFFREIRAERAKLANLANVCKFLAGSFSAVSKRNFASKYASDCSFQSLQDVHTFAPQQNVHGVKSKSPG